MFKMIELVGSSQKGFDEAIESAVKELAAKGEKIHFFQVIEQRGSFRNNKVEYQVIIKVAVEA